MSGELLLFIIIHLSISLTELAIPYRPGGKIRMEVKGFIWRKELLVVILGVITTYH